MSTNTHEFAEIRIQVFASAATKVVEEIIKSRKLPYSRIVLYSTQTFIDAVFCAFAHREDISWFVKSFLTGWLERPDTTEKIKIYVSRHDGTVVSIDAENISVEKIQAFLAEPYVMSSLTLDYGISTHKGKLLSASGLCSVKEEDPFFCLTNISSPASATTATPASPLSIFFLTTGWLKISIIKLSFMKIQTAIRIKPAARLSRFLNVPPEQNTIFIFTSAVRGISNLADRMQEKQISVQANHFLLSNGLSTTAASR